MPVRSLPRQHFTQDLLKRSKGELWEESSLKDTTAHALHLALLLARHSDRHKINVDEASYSNSVLC